MAQTTLRISNRSIVRAVVIAGAYLVAATVIGRATGTLSWFIEAAAFAALGYPLVQRLGRHMPKFVAILLLTAVVAGVVSLLAATALKEMQSESARFRRSVPAAVADLERTDGIGTIVKKLKLCDDFERFADDVAERLRFQDVSVPGIAGKVGGSASAVLVVWILTVMLVFTGPTMINGGLNLVSNTSAREAVRSVLSAGYGRSVRYLGLMTLRSLVLGVITFTAATSLGLDMPGMLATVAALLGFVPYVGILGASLPFALMSLLNGSREAVIVLVVAVILQTVDAVVVQRRIDAATVPLGVFPTLVAAMLGFSLRGPGGMLVGVALAALVLSIANDAGAMQTLRAGLTTGPGAPPVADPVAAGTFGSVATNEEAR
ncbi:hypothetical protein BH10ACT3_BH10ACT3_13130 [soil metagenome]